MNLGGEERREARRAGRLGGDGVVVGALLEKSVAVSAKDVMSKKEAESIQRQRRQRQG